MPVYIFKCDNSICRRVEEITFRMKDCPDRVRCPHCRAADMRKQIGVGVRLITQPHWQRPENSMYPGMSEREIVEEIKGDDKVRIAAHERDEERRKANTPKFVDPYPDQLGFQEYAEMGYDVPTPAEMRKLAAECPVGAQ